MNEEINKLKLEIEELKNKNNELEEKLKSYTNPERNKKYYEKNSNIVKEKAKKYMEKMKETNPEKIKELGDESVNFAHDEVANGKTHIDVSDVSRKASDGDQLRLALQANVSSQPMVSAPERPVADVQSVSEGISDTCITF